MSQKKLTTYKPLPCLPKVSMAVSQLRHETDSASGRSLKTEWFNSIEAAEFLRLSVKALRNKTSNGQVPFHKFGRLNRYRKDELEAMLLSQKRGKHGNQT